MDASCSHDLFQLNSCRTLTCCYDLVDSRCLIFGNRIRDGCLNHYMLGTFG